MEDVAPELVGVFVPVEGPVREMTAGDYAAFRKGTKEYGPLNSATDGYTIRPVGDFQPKSLRVAWYLNYYAKTPRNERASRLHGFSVCGDAFVFKCGNWPHAPMHDFGISVDELEEILETVSEE